MSFDEDFSDIISNFHNYGSRPASFFPDFYAKTDIVLSATRANTLRPGAFDGYPMSVEASFCGCALFASNPMKTTSEYVSGSELVDVQTDVDDIVQKIEYYIEHVSELYEISEKGQKKTQILFDLNKQKKDREEFIEKYLGIKTDNNF